jgi:predicted metal-dependent hydrolase
MDLGSLRKIVGAAGNTDYMKRASPPWPAGPRSIVIAGRRLDYRLRTSPLAKGITMRVTPKGINVTLPYWGTEREAETFVWAHLDWLMAQMERVSRLEAARLQQTPPGEIQFRGRTVSVRIEPDLTVSPDGVWWEGDTLVVATPDGSPTPAHKVLERWLREEARLDLAAEVMRASALLNLPSPARVFIRDQRTRWGTCSSLGNLSFNWRLIMAPHYVLRYVATHEVAHLRQMNHSCDFWRLVNSACHDTDRAREWLKRNGPAIMFDLAEVFRDAGAGPGPLDRATEARSG